MLVLLENMKVSDVFLETNFQENLLRHIDFKNSEMETKVFNDSIHGHMYFHPLLVIVADTPQVQRLRNIKQLGVCHFVYPSATHSRFEHSLGTAFIAGKIFNNLKQKRIPSDITDELAWEKTKLCAQIAGLCHDLGHGPFSHTWERFRRKMNDNWTHEIESVEVFEELLKEKISPTKKFNGADLHFVKDAFTYYGLNECDIENIKIMILGRKSPKHYMFQVINNKINNIDVDKWDYLVRDSSMLNLPIAFDYRRLLKYCCILKNDNGEEEICFREKECRVLVEMFLARGRLHDTAYQHTKVRIIEEMLTDAFVLANDRLQLSETPITKLTDHIYQKILYEDFGCDENMNKAKNLLRRIESRHLYKCVAREAYEGETPDFEVIKTCLSNEVGMEGFINEIAITLISLDMTNSNKEKALKNVLVYRKGEGDILQSKMFDWSKYQDCLKPNVFDEITVQATPIERENLQRKQILILYKGTKEFPKELRADIRERLRSILDG